MPFAKFLIQLEFLQNRHNIFSNLLTRYLPGLWNSVINALVLLLIDLIARLRLYSDYVAYQRFISKVSIFYLTVNILLLPLISMSASSDIIDVTMKAIAWQRFSQSFIYSQSCRSMFDEATFYMTILMQYASNGFLFSVVRIADLFNFWGNLAAVDRHFDRLRRRTMDRRENEVYEYGYFFALSATLINATSAFG